MSFSAKFAGRCALATVTVALLCSLPCSAQEAPGKKAAHAEAEKALAEESGGGPNPLAVDPDLAIWTGVVFVLLFFVLKVAAWPQITAALTERERKIEGTIADANAKLEEAKKLYAEHEAKLAAAAGEVRAMLEEARRDAEQTKKAIEGEGQKAAKDELDRALREIHRARDAAVQELAISSANTAVDLAKKIIHDGLTPEKNNQIIRDAMAKLAAATSKN